VDRGFRAFFSLELDTVDLQRAYASPGGLGYFSLEIEPDWYLKFELQMQM
jgi:hypothetical protein